MQMTVVSATFCRWAPSTFCSALWFCSHQWTWIRKGVSIVYDILRARLGHTRLRAERIKYCRWAFTDVSSPWLQRCVSWAVLPAPGRSQDRREHVPPDLTELSHCRRPQEVFGIELWPSCTIMPLNTVAVPLQGKAMTASAFARLPVGNGGNCRGPSLSPGKMRPSVALRRPARFWQRRAWAKEAFHHALTPRASRREAQACGRLPFGGPACRWCAGRGPAHSACTRDSGNGLWSSLGLVSPSNVHIWRFSKSLTIPITWALRVRPGTEVDVGTRVPLFPRRKVPAHPDLEPHWGPVWGSRC